MKKLVRKYPFKYSLHTFCDASALNLLHLFASYLT